MSCNSIADLCKYHSGAYESFGYQTAEDSHYLILRNCVLTLEQHPEKMTPKTTSSRKSNAERDYKIIAITVNTLTACGYIPGIALLPGVINISRGAIPKENRVSFGPKIDKPYRFWAITKGVFQTVGLGIIFLPTDLWVTRQKRCNPPKPADLLDRTKYIASGKLRILDRLREKEQWSTYNDGL